MRALLCPLRSPGQACDQKAHSFFLKVGSRELGSILATSLCYHSFDIITNSLSSCLGSET